MNFEHGRSTTVTTDKGDVRGFKHNGIYHFWGLEYAFANRYEEPREVEPWEGYKEATNYGYISPPAQYNRLGNHIKNPYRYWPMNDHCQFLNVWTRDLDPTKKKPVMFWIHGGGFNDGSAIEHEAYSGFNMAKVHDVCFVSVNHRLNCLGYLDLSSFSPKYKRSVNLGMLDLIEALKWVQRNIEKFGGDPNNVTILGQSGGGAKVCTLLNMPAAEGLFHKAVVMSGCSNMRAYNDERDTDPVVRKALEILGIPENEIEKIETVNHEKLINAINKACKELNFGRMRYAPKKNEDYLGDPILNGYSEFAKKIPIIIGGTFSEFKYNFGPDYRGEDLEGEAAIAELEKKFGKEKVEKALPLFRKAFPDKKDIDLLWYETKSYREGSKQMIEARLRDNCAPIWNYMFAPTTKINGHSTPVHSYEIPFFFHNTEIIPSCDLGGDATERVELQCSGRYANFARYGKPQLAGQPYWPECKPGYRPTLIIDDNTRVEVNYDDELDAVLSAK